MRALTGLFSVVTVAAFGFACGALALAYIAPEPGVFVPPERSAILASLEVDTSDVPDNWPEVFGTIPEPELEPEPEPVVAEEPPEENTTYYLTGLVAGRGSESWALISENDRGLVVRVGDQLVGGETVMAIDAAGVWIEYKGERQLIPVQKSELDHLVTVEADTGADRPAPKLLAEVTIPIEQLNRRFIERALASAGRLAATERGNRGGMDIVWIRQGELFDQMGLRTGDTILSVNGKTLQSEDLLADMPDADLMDGTLQLEIIREGTRQMVRVNLDQG